MDLIILIVLVSVGLPVATGSECCDGYYDISNSWQDPQWCDTYCCGTTTTSLYCCKSSILQARSLDRSDFCGLWWKHNVWAPIITALVSLGILIGCCVCCYKCCCAPNRTTTVFVQNPAQMAPGPMISTTMVSNHTSVNAGYNQPGQY